MKKNLLVTLLSLVVGCLTVESAYASELQWNRNTEDDMKQYHVYVCKVRGCTATNIGADWMATVPQVPVTQPTVRWTIPAGIDGGATVTAEDLSANMSAAAVPVNFTTVPNTPPAGPSGLRFLP